MSNIGKQTKKYFSSARSYGVLDSNPETHGCTWTSGGCGIAALGIHRALPGSEIHGVFAKRKTGEGDTLHHAVVKHEGLYLDADGASTRKELLHRWSNQEGLKNPTVRPLGVDELTKSEEIPTDGRSQTTVTNHLQGLFHDRR